MKTLCLVNKGEINYEFVLKSFFTFEKIQVTLHLKKKDLEERGTFDVRFI